MGAGGGFYPDHEIVLIEIFKHINKKLIIFFNSIVPIKRFP